MILSDLVEMKTRLEIPQDDISEDTNLTFAIEEASNWIEEYLGNRPLFYKTRTEYPKSYGTEKMLLKARPVFPSPTDGNSAITVNIDEQGFFGSATGAFTGSSVDDLPLVYGTDYCLDIDSDDGSSRSGILYRIGDLWPRPYVRKRGYLAPYQGTALGNVQVIYTAGFTIDTLPATIRSAMVMLVSKIRYILPLGLELGSDSYIDRSISISPQQRDYLMGLVLPLLFTYRNWNFGGR